MYLDFYLPPSCHWGMTLGRMSWEAEAPAAILVPDVRTVEQQDKRGVHL